MLGSGDHQKPLATWCVPVFPGGVKFCLPVVLPPLQSCSVPLFFPYLFGPPCSSASPHSQLSWVLYQRGDSPWVCPSGLLVGSLKTFQMPKAAGAVVFLLVQCRVSGHSQLGSESQFSPETLDQLCKLLKLQVLNL